MAIMMMTRSRPPAPGATILLSMVQDVMNFLSPQPAKIAEPVALPRSPKELILASETEEEEEVIYNAGERHDIVEALKFPIVPGGDWLRKTLPSGDLDNMLNQIHGRKQVQEPQAKPPSNIMTCTRCMLGKEESRKQTLLHKADKQARRTLQKCYNRLEKELK